MNFLSKERTTLEEFLPTLDTKLEKIPFLLMESRKNPAIQVFRQLGGPGLLIPRQYGGLGATPLQMLRIQRAIASRSPSLAIAANMHHCTVAAMLETTADEFSSEIFANITQHNLYLASGFAEGQTNTSVLSPLMKAERTDNGLIVSGSKKPCSLSASMDFLTASLLVPSNSGEEDSELALAIVPADSPGIERRHFWSSWVLAGAESDEVILNDVFVPKEYITYLGNPDNLSLAIAKAFLWFELTISASYLGVASGLVERVIAANKGSAAERMVLGIEVEGAMAALEGVAYSLMLNITSEAEVAQALFVRYTVQQAIERVSVSAAELLGGMAFVSSCEIAYLLAACRALAFHPPSRLSMSIGLDRYLAGEPLVMP